MNKAFYFLLYFCGIVFMPTLNAQSTASFKGLLQKKKNTITNQLNHKDIDPAKHQPGFSSSPADVIRRNCGQLENEAWLKAQYPDRQNIADFEAEFAPLVSAYKATASNRSGAVITIPVIVHVVHNGESVGSGPNISQAQVESQIDVLNEDYRRTGNGANNHPDGADMEVEFKLALFDPQGNQLAEPGIHRIHGGRSWWDVNTCNATLKPQTYWDPNRYFNIWTVNFDGSAQSLLGYAQFPNLSNLPGLDQNMGEAKTDGVVVRYNAFGRVGNVHPNFSRGRTTSHEAGHWLGLRHIWGDGGCSVDDFCNDTPVSGQPNYQCFAVNSCPGGGNDMVENFMDYSNDACMNLFTQDQKARVRAVLQNSPRRKSLPNSTVDDELGNSNQPIAFFSADATEACTGTSIQLLDESNNSPTSWTWNIYDESGNLLGTFNQQNPSLTFNSPGIYTVELIVSNSAGNSTHVEENYISILSSNSYTEYIEDFESDQGLLQDWVVYNPDADRGPALAGVSSFGNGSRSVVFDNFDNEDDPTGTIDALISARFNFNGLAAPYLYLEHAYAQYGGQYSDTLVLYYSLDCGQTFTPFWYKGGHELATADPTQNSFVPTANQWDWNQVSLGFLAGQTNVHIAIANYSGWGNNLYLDQISIIDAQNYTNQATQANFAVGRTTVCAGDIVQFQDFSSEFPLQWQWQFEGGNPASSNFQHPFVQYNQIGLFDVSLTAGNAFGSDGVTASNFIEVLPLPQVFVSASTTQLCAGEAVTLTASGATDYEWYDQFNGSLMFEGQQLTVSVYEDRTFLVLGINSAGCIGEAQYTVDVIDDPIPTITSNGGQLSTNSGQSYQWYFNGSPIASGQGGNQQTINAAQIGTYYVEITYASGCTLRSLDFTYDPTFIDDLTNISSAVKLSPNPGQGVLQLEVTHPATGSFELKVINSLGQLAYSTTLNKQGTLGFWQLDLGNLPDGTYLLSLTNAQHRALKKYVKGE